MKKINQTINKCINFQDEKKDEDDAFRDDGKDQDDNKNEQVETEND